MNGTVRSLNRAGRRGLLVAALAVFVAIPATEASAGRLLVTGHDWDFHCASSPPSQCHYTKVGVKYVRAGSNKPVLVLDQPDFDVGNALDSAFSPSFPREVVTPSSDRWKTMKLTPRKWSAILVASDTACGGCDLNQIGVEDSEAINKRKRAIARYFNKGGGIMVGAGDEHGDGNDPDDIYYDFVPIPVGGVAVTQPFTLTPLGERIGFRDNAAAPGGSDINCCPTHNSFRKPRRGGALKVAEKDSEGFAETLVAKGQIVGGQIVGDGGPLKLRVSPKEVNKGENACFDFKVTSGGKTINNATVKFGGDRVKTNRNGKGTICRSFGSLGKKTAKATKSGFDPDTAATFVVRAPGFTG